MTYRIGIVDTTFSRVNMGQIALDELRRRAKDAAASRRGLSATAAADADLRRVTVPGVKDLPAAARRFFDEGCDLVIACGMVGAEEVDKVCGHEASQGLMWLSAWFGRPVLEVFVHMDEAKDDAQLAWLATRRTEEHALNAYWMLYEPQRLIELAGTGQRQGFDDAGPVR